MTVVEDQEYFRFFETWIPRKAPRFGKTKETRAKSDVEAYESAPEGLVVKASNDAYYLVTGRTIEKDSLRRGCPTPIRLVIARSQGNSWDNSQIARFVLSFCFMGRASGHLTRFPSPLYYLRLYAHYVHNYGLPEHANIRERPFYV